MSLTTELLSALGNSKPLTGSGSYQEISCGSGAAVTLTIPNSAIAAIIQVGMDASLTDSDDAITYKINGDAPTASSGFVLRNQDEYTLLNRDQMANFKAIGITSGKTHKLRVQYYGRTSN